MKTMTPERRLTSVVPQTSPSVVAQSVEPKRHPLVELPMRKFKSFDEWLEVWNSPELGLQYAMVRLGLLYSLQTEETFWWAGNREKVVMFLLTIADGFASDGPFLKPHEQLGRGSKKFHSMEDYEFKREIALRAYNILCLKFFRNKSTDDDNKPSYSYSEPLWAWVMQIGHIEIINKILGFFRVKDGTFGEGIENISQEHHTEIVALFLSEFAKVCIQLLEYRPDREYSRVFGRVTDLQMRLFLLSLRPQCVSFLNQVGGLNWLLKSDLALFEPEDILEKLRQLALGGTYHLPGSDCKDGSMSDFRKPISLDEAILGGSTAAKILTLYRIQAKTAGHLERLYRASVRKRDDQLRLDKIVETETAIERLQEQKRGLVKKT